MRNEAGYKELATLIEKISSGNQEAFEEYYLKTYKAQYYLAVKNTHDYELAKDVVQEVYIKLLSYIDKIKDINFVVSYMNKMNYSISIDMLKKRNELQTIDYEGIDEDFAIEQPEENDDYIYKAVNELDDELKEIVILRFINKLKVKDIAVSKNLSTRTINRMLKKALSILKISIKGMRNASFLFLPMSWYLKVYLNVNHININVSTISIIYTRIAKNTWTLSRSLSTNKIAKAMNSKIIFSHTIIIAGVSTVFITGSFILAPPQFDIIRKEKSSNFTNEETFIIKRNLLVGINEVNVYDEWRNLYLNGNIDGDGELKVNHNGNYTIELIDNLGRSSTKNIYVSTIDEISPELVSANYNEKQYEIILKDDLSGIDTKSIKIVDSNENSLDYETEEVDLTTVKVIVKTKQEHINVDISDQIGNTNSLDIELE
ncbi:sigma-70 family RNA polymerase sigma factor [Anaerorhabdus sp.]|uniref:RNA polymerase sigma factor n=1 Tax=Anaerorhabdus sp. TaxID=1872524 RepID=UPI002B21E97C|nr:sigma-70 family RNA polymerase sigma factor [Anaerorhabdus sp.]MEA4875546.1 sigma-70 family RNA polymerase sigma factor [Anaerorhabdus sp.]